MKILPIHTLHTIVSGDAHSTLLENLRAAKEQGLKFLCVTEHVNSIPRAATSRLFQKACALSRESMRGCS